ncbi:MAG: acylphosphatase [Dehalococcoidia bacterium]
MNSNAMLRALVRGRTQGVGFRAFVLDRAGRLGLSGYVRNMSDGSIAEGPQERLDLLLAALRQGPPMSAVHRVDASWGEATGEYPGFDIR